MLFSLLVREMELHICAAAFVIRIHLVSFPAAKDYSLCSDLLLLLDKSMSAGFPQELNMFLGC